MILVRGVVESRVSTWGFDEDPTSGRVTRTVSAVREATLRLMAQGKLSQKAWEVAHLQLFRSTFKDNPALYFLVKMAHPLLVG